MLVLESSYIQLKKNVAVSIILFLQNVGHCLIRQGFLSCWESLAKNLFKKR